MARIFLAPLFIAIMAFGAGLLFAYVRMRSRPGLSLGKPIALMAAALVLLTFLSIPAVSGLLAYHLEKPYLVFDYDGIGEVDVVTILSGTVMKAPDARANLPGYASSLRVIRGVRLFKAFGADSLVMQGWPHSAGYGQMTDMMVELAVEMGVPLERIVVEPLSRNTYEHPRKLLEHTDVKPSDRIAVVTSAYHLKRAEREYTLYFDNVIPVPADFLTPASTSRRWTRYLPQAGALQVSTAVIQEYIGIAWYRIRHAASRE